MQVPLFRDVINTLEGSDRVPFSALFLAALCDRMRRVHLDQPPIAWRSTLAQNDASSSAEAEAMTLAVNGGGTEMYPAVMVIVLDAIANWRTKDITAAVSYAVERLQWEDGALLQRFANVLLQLLVCRTRLYATRQSHLARSGVPRLAPTAAD